MNDGNLIVDDVFINADLIKTKFTCDLLKCKGACCTMDSEYGAPIKESEIEEIDKVLTVLKNYLPKKHLKDINKFGFWETKQNQLFVRSINRRECVFAFYDNDVAKCGLERAFNDGKSSFRKPISCHLFPIRITDFGGQVLRYEEYSECKPALEKGNQSKLNILQYCKDSLERVFGRDWVEKVMLNMEK